jgi:hypothetical protein
MNGNSLLQQDIADKGGTGIDVAHYESGLVQNGMVHEFETGVVTDSARFLAVDNMLFAEQRDIAIGVFSGASAHIQQCTFRSTRSNGNAGSFILAGNGGSLSVADSLFEMTQDWTGVSQYNAAEFSIERCDFKFLGRYSTGVDSFSHSNAIGESGER